MCSLFLWLNRECENPGIASCLRAKSDRESETRDRVSDLCFKSDRESETRDRVSDLRFKSDRENETRDRVSDLRFKLDRERVKSIFMCTFIFSLCVFKPHLVSILILFTGEWYHSPVNKIFVNNV